MGEEIQSETVVIEVSGTVFHTTSLILQNIPGSLLAKLDPTSQYYNKNKKAYIFEGDPACFKYVLKAYKTGQLHLSRDMCPVLFRQEIEFWEIPLSLLSPCCWKTFYGTSADLDVISVLLQRLTDHPPLNKVGVNAVQVLTPQSMTKDQKKGDNPSEERKGTAHALWLFLEEPRSSFVAKIWCYVYISIVLVSVTVVLLWMTPSCRVDAYLNPIANFSYSQLPPVIQLQPRLLLKTDVSAHGLLFRLTDPHPAVFAGDIFCLLFFLVETVIHFCVCPKKWDYFKSFDNKIKIAVCLAMLVSLVVEVNRQVLDSDIKLEIFIMVKSISVARMILIFRLRKLYNCLDLLLLSLEGSLKELCLLVFVFWVSITVYGTMMFCAEAKTDTFDSVWNAVWWALVTMTTVGYGDYYPTTTTGYIVGSLCLLHGLIMIALPIAAIASNFSTYYTVNADIKRHQTVTKAQTNDKQKHKNKLCS